MKLFTIFKHGKQYAYKYNSILDFVVAGQREEC